MKKCQMGDVQMAKNKFIDYFQVVNSEFFFTTETFGVDALAQEVAEKFDLPYEFIPTECTL